MRKYESSILDIMDEKLKDSLLLNGISIEYQDKLNIQWNESHRYYHDVNHLYNILNLIDNDLRTTPEQKNDLRTIAAYHDCVYNPREKNNEQLSADQYKAETTSFNIDVYNAIVDTKDHTQQPSSILSEYFLEYDLHNLLHGSLSQLIDDSNLLLKEFGFLDWSILKAGRISFMENIAPYIKSKSTDTHIDEYIEWIKLYTPKIAVFAGSFFPIHNGHINVLNKAERIFDKVIVACGQNSAKPYTLSTIENNVFNIQKILPNNQVEFFPGFLTDYISDKPYPLTIVKGLRNPSDFDNEKLSLRWMEDLSPNIDIVYIISDRQYEHVSSSGIKMVQQIQAVTGNSNNITSKYIPNERI